MRLILSLIYFTSLFNSWSLDVKQKFIPQSGSIEATVSISTSGSLTANSLDVKENLKVDENTFFVDSSTKRVGVGIASMSSALHVQKNQAATTALIVGNNTANSAAQAAVYVNANGNNFSLINYPDEDAANANLTRFFSSASDGKFIFSPDSTETLTVDGGLVGIGTNSPGYPLEVAEDGTTTPKVLIRSVSNGDSTLSFLSDSQQFTLGIDDTNNGFSISQGSVVGSTDRLAIDASGDVGIGTSSPNARFEVANSLTSGTILRISNDNDFLSASDYVGKLEFYSEEDSSPANTVRAYVGAKAADAFNRVDLVFATGNFSSAATERMLIDSYGNVAVYNGNLVVGSTSTSYEIEAATGQVAGAGAYVNTSDKRLKKDVEPIQNACAKVMQLEPVLYNWKTRFIPEDKKIVRSVNFYDSVTKTIEVTKLVSIDGEKFVTTVPEVITEKVMKKSEFTNNRLREINQPHGQKDIGFLAQDVEPVFPQAVSIDERGKYLLAYSKFIPLQTACIQEQQQELTDLKVKFQSVVDRLDLLESQ